MNMATYINLDDPQYRDAAAQMLSRHDALQPEANITSAVRQFLVLTGLVRNEEIVEENPPSDSSRRAVDLTAPGQGITGGIGTGLKGHGLTKLKCAITSIYRAF